MGALRFFLLQLLSFRLVTSDISFIYNGFSDANLSFYGASHVTHRGILEVTNDASKLMGHSFYPSLLRFKQNDTEGHVTSFSTTFVFSITPKYPDLGGHGLAFVLISTKEPRDCLGNQYLGLPNLTSNAEFSTRVVAVEFDVVQNLELEDINDNHVGIDINTLNSNRSEPAAYYTTRNQQDNVSIDLKSGAPVHAWIDYIGKDKLITVTICPYGMPRPTQPLITFSVDLSLVIAEYMYVGFSASTGLLAATHSVLGWSFRIGGKAQDLDPSLLPTLIQHQKVVHKTSFAVGIALACATLALLVICAAHQVAQRRKHGDEALEDWEVEYGARRFEYSELLEATRGFGDENLIGSGGFGSVYKGFVPSTGLEMAIKRIAHNSRQGMREFVAEIMSMGRLRHRNLAQLHGWCKSQNELLLVYDYVPNGSLDKLLLSTHKKFLNWEQRYKILIGVAQALLYLHEECEQRVVHRDVKPSNVLIDEDLNAKLGDFGLARIYDHDINPQTTNIVGTLGYLAPELTKTGKATTSTDVFSYGTLLLEVATGRRPIEPQRSCQELVLLDWVRELHSRGETMNAIDTELESYNKDEAELVLKLGLLCSHPRPGYRPNMRRIVQFLLGDATLPELPLDVHLDVHGPITDSSDGYFDDSNPSSGPLTSTKSTTSFTSFEQKFVAQTSRVTY
ncbi:hypothetical protein AQUCO_00500212v1 [Aquilegia coerulea]|uniref:non-specific serine/threonine protein kinase n=1 Tax=Aquilegia coerulea TaxID=218851 RepID=A0A2G5EQV3_AQUCA|nr:hypothetical protein AQUCO_00500212v1 [Aquilegia coerulea]